jgi:hypothetical protein
MNRPMKPYCSCRNLIDATETLREEIMTAINRTLLESPKGQLSAAGFVSGSAYVSAKENASRVMTDFKTGPMITTLRSASIELTLQQMKISGARFTFVVDERGALLGSVTSYDIQGEKPMRYMQSVGCSHKTCAWRDVLVENIMEPSAEWLVLDHAHVARLTVGEVAALMFKAGRRYLVVVERLEGDAAWQVRGLFSGARIQMLLGASPPGVTPAHSSAELGRKIA